MRSIHYLSITIILIYIIISQKFKKFISSNYILICVTIYSERIYVMKRSKGGICVKFFFFRVSKTITIFFTFKKFIGFFTFPFSFFPSNGVSLFLPFYLFTFLPLKSPFLQTVICPPALWPSIRLLPKSMP